MRFIIFFAMLVSSVSVAQADSSTGCGLGSLIWEKNSIVSALFRATTNHSFSSQLFGITSGTSGCSQHSIVKREMYPVYYAEANLPELRHEMAYGQGEYLATFSEVLGCNPQGQVEFMKWAKNSYPVMFMNAQSSSSDLLVGLKDFKNTSIAKSCNNLAII